MDLAQARTNSMIVCFSQKKGRISYSVIASKWIVQIRAADVDSKPGDIVTYDLTVQNTLNTNLLLKLHHFSVVRHYYSILEKVSVKW